MIFKISKYGIKLIVALSSTNEIKKKKWLSSGESKARSDCTYLWVDLEVHSSKNRFMVANGRMRVNKKYL